MASEEVPGGYLEMHGEVEEDDAEAEGGAAVEETWESKPRGGLPVAVLIFTTIACKRWTFRLRSSCSARVTNRSFLPVHPNIRNFEFRA